jgi:hypothetical protein
MDFNSLEDFTEVASMRKKGASMSKDAPIITAITKRFRREGLPDFKIRSLIPVAIVEESYEGNHPKKCYGHGSRVSHGEFVESPVIDLMHHRRSSVRRTPLP